MAILVQILLAFSLHLFWLPWLHCRHGNLSKRTAGPHDDPLQASGLISGAEDDVVDARTVQQPSQHFAHRAGSQPGDHGLILQLWS